MIWLSNRCTLALILAGCSGNPSSGIAAKSSSNAPSSQSVYQRMYESTTESERAKALASALALPAWEAFTILQQTAEPKASSEIFLSTLNDFVTHTDHTSTLADFARISQLKPQLDTPEQYAVQLNAVSTPENTLALLAPATLDPRSCPELIDEFYNKGGKSLADLTATFAMGMPFKNNSRVNVRVAGNLVGEPSLPIFGSAGVRAYFWKCLGTKVPNDTFEGYTPESQGPYVDPGDPSHGYPGDPADSQEPYFSTQDQEFLRSIGYDPVLKTWSS